MRYYAESGVWNVNVDDNGGGGGGGIVHEPFGVFIAFDKYLPELCIKKNIVFVFGFLLAAVTPAATAVAIPKRMSANGNKIDSCVVERASWDFFFHLSVLELFVYFNLLSSFWLVSCTLYFYLHNICFIWIFICIRLIMRAMRVAMSICITQNRCFFELAWHFCVPLFSNNNYVLSFRSVLESYSRTRHTGEWKWQCECAGNWRLRSAPTDGRPFIWMTEIPFSWFMQITALQCKQRRRRRRPRKR